MTSAVCQLMPMIFDRLPFDDAITTLEVQGQTFRILPLQIVVWVSLSVRGLRTFDRHMPRFPAVFDPGYTDDFLIHPQHLRRLAGIQLAHLPQPQYYLRSHGRVIPLHAANLWLHLNRANQRELFSTREPYLVELDRGIGVPSDLEIYPRLPLLGARTMGRAGLRVHIDYAACSLSVRTRRKFWLFG